MAAQTSSCCKTSTARTTRRRFVPAVAPRRPLPTSRNKATGNGKASIRRCVEVRRKMEALRRLVPSGDGEEADDGRRLDLDELLFRAADYIVRLQVQVKLMQLMVDVLEYTKD